MSVIQRTQERSLLARIFLSPEEPRLRAGWRLLIQTILLVVLVLVMMIGSQLVGVQQDALNSIWGNTIVLFLAFTISVYIARCWLDNRSFASLGLNFDKQTLPDILTGISIAFLQLGFMFAVLLSLGWLIVEGFAWEFDPVVVIIANVLTFFVVYIFVGWYEELLSRGYHLQTVASGSSLFWGVIISSSVFGLLHLVNSNVSWTNTAGVTAGIFFAGVYLAYAYLRTRQLWLPIGLHIGWNFAQGVLFGFPVSGSDSYPLIRVSLHGPELWTGGRFGPESGLIVLPGLVIGVVLIYLYTKRRAR